MKYVFNKIEKAQYDAALAITGAVRGTSREKFYAELGLESLLKPLNISHCYCRTDTFKNSFFPNFINEWNKLDEKIKGVVSFSLFKASLLKMVRPHANSIYRIHNPVRIKLLTHLCLVLIHLNEQNFRHNFADYASAVLNL